jgi:hypothetical protein
MVATSRTGNKQQPMSQSAPGKVTERLFGMGFLSVVVFGAGLAITRFFLVGLTAD